MPNSFDRATEHAHLARRVIAVAFAWLFASFANFAIGQQPIQATAPTPTHEVAAEAQSPRATMEVYLTSISAWRANRRESELESAIRCFDTRGYSGTEARYAGELWATRLIDVLDKVRRIDLGEIADASAVAGQTKYSFSISNAAHADIVFSIAFVKSEDGQWLVARETGAKIQDWGVATATWPTIAGLEKHMTIAERVRATVPVRMQQTAFWLEHWQWIGLLLLVLVGVVVRPIVGFFFRRLLDRMGRAEHIKLDRKLLASFDRPMTILITAIVFVRGLYLLDLDPAAFNILHIAGSFAITVAGVWASYRLVDVVCQYLAEKAALTESKFDDMLVPLLRRTLKIVVLLLGFSYLLAQISDDIWKVVAGLSIGTLAVGFAAKDSIENLFGTFTVLLDKPFQLGDVIKVGDVEGTVEDVGFRSTRVRTGEDSLITVPNSRFISANVDNLGARRYRRVRSFIGLTYDTPPELVEAFCEGLREFIRRNPNARQDNFEVALYQLSASSIDVLIQFYVRAPDFRDDVRERNAIYTFVLQLAKRLKIQLAFPTQSIVVVENDEGRHAGAPSDHATARELGRSVVDEIAPKTADAKQL